MTSRRDTWVPASVADQRVVMVRALFVLVAFIVIGGVVVILELITP